MSLSADMQQRIEKSDAQEIVDEAQLKGLVFENSRIKFYVKVQN